MWEQELNTIIKHCDLLVSSNIENFTNDFFKAVQHISSASSTLLELTKNIPNTPIEFKEYVYKLGKIETTNLAHELRLPMSSIRGYCLVISDGYFGDLDDTQYKHLQIIYDTNEQLKAWFTEFLGDIFPAISVGPSQLLFSEMFDIAAVLNELIFTISNSSENKYKFLTIRLAINDRVDKVYADSYRTKQILLNILSLFRSNDEKSCLTIEAKPYEENGSFVQISVINESDWIDLKQYDPILNPKKTATDNSLHEFTLRERAIAKRNMKPISEEKLSLILAQGLIEKQGGKLWIESEVGVKPAFYFTIPTQPKQVS
jgi:signal transduction histidine kinase